MGGGWKEEGVVALNLDLKELLLKVEVDGGEGGKGKSGKAPPSSSMNEDDSFEMSWSMNKEALRPKRKRYRAWSRRTKLKFRTSVGWRAAGAANYKAAWKRKRQRFTILNPIIIFRYPISFHRARVEIP